MGNSCVRAERHLDALRFYQRALLVAAKGPGGSVSNTNITACQANMSAALLKLCRYSEAYDTAKTVLDGADVDASLREKALFRLGAAAYGMRQWDQAKTHYQHLLTLFPRNQAARAELRRVSLRIAEARTGRYGPGVLDVDGQDSQKRHDVADYSTPVKVAPVPDKGLGLVTTTVVSAGALLLVSRAFHCTTVEPGSEEGQCVSHLNSIELPSQGGGTTKRGLNAEKTSDYAHIVNTMHHLMRNPQMTKELYSLWAGGEWAEERCDAKALADIPPGGWQVKGRARREFLKFLKFKKRIFKNYF
jgi:tetratricopeptide (TPR) repeat protein